MSENTTKIADVKTVGTTPIVEFRNVTARFGSFTAVNDILCCRGPSRVGEFISIIGPSDAEKYGFKSAGRLLKPSEGQILVNETN
jgi:ABC-type branched-subunit amino acid transport system ATPase component